MSDPAPITPELALERLAAGNRRFRDGSATSRAVRWDALGTGPQRPFAIILGCSDSRIPVEIVFDAGFGELFVVRVAGNIVAPSLVGSIEFAASQFGAQLVVVMGHTDCGAVAATLHALETGMGPESKNIRAITDRIAPHLEGLARTGDRVALAHSAVRANVRASADHLRHGSPLLEELIAAGRLAVVGAEYDLGNGTVDFFDRRGLPTS